MSFSIGGFLPRPPTAAMSPRPHDAGLVTFDRGRLAAQDEGDLELLDDLHDGNALDLP